MSDPMKPISNRKRNKNLKTFNKRAKRAKLAEAEEAKEKKAQAKFDELQDEHFKRLSASALREAKKDKAYKLLLDQHEALLVLSTEKNVIIAEKDEDIAELNVQLDDTLNMFKITEVSHKLELGTLLTNKRVLLGRIAEQNLLVRQTLTTPSMYTRMFWTRLPCQLASSSVPDKNCLRLTVPPFRAFLNVSKSAEVRLAEKFDIYTKFGQPGRFQKNQSASHFMDFKYPEDESGKTWKFFSNLGELQKDTTWFTRCFDVTSSHLGPTNQVFGMKEFLKFFHKDDTHKNGKLVVFVPDFFTGPQNLESEDYDDSGNEKKAFNDKK